VAAPVRALPPPPPVGCARRRRCRVEGRSFFSACSVSASGPRRTYASHSDVHPSQETPHPGIITLHTCRAIIHVGTQSGNDHRYTPPWRQPAYTPPPHGDCAPHPRLYCGIGSGVIRVCLWSSRRWRTAVRHGAAGRSPRHTCPSTCAPTASCAAVRALRPHPSQNVVESGHKTSSHGHSARVVRAQHHEHARSTFPWPHDAASLAEGQALRERRWQHRSPVGVAITPGHQCSHGWSSPARRTDPAERRLL